MKYTLIKKKLIVLICVRFSFVKKYFSKVITFYCGKNKLFFFFKFLETITPYLRSHCNFKNKNKKIAAKTITQVYTKKLKNNPQCDIGFYLFFVLIKNILEIAAQQEIIYIYTYISIRERVSFFSATFTQILLFGKFQQYCFLFPQFCKTKDFSLFQFQKCCSDKSYISGAVFFFSHFQYMWRNLKMRLKKKKRVC